VILEFFNPAFWSDADSLAQPNWSLNGVMVEVGAHERRYWLGDEDVTFFEPPPELPAAPDAEATVPAPRTTPSDLPLLSIGGLTKEPTSHV
jgi:oxygen-independent coproporphyrinogen-3 oxidase